LQKYNKINLKTEATFEVKNICFEVKMYVLRSKCTFWGQNVRFESKTYVLRSKCTFWGKNICFEVKNVCFEVKNICCRPTNVCFKVKNVHFEAKNVNFETNVVCRTCKRHLLHAVSFSKELLWFEPTKVIPLQTQTHVVNDCCNTA